MNIVTGAGETGAHLVNHPRRATRSPSPAPPRSASSSSAPCAGTGKKLTLELGGKAANIIFEDAPIDQAVEGIVNGIFFNQGHVCCAGSRLLVQESIEPSSAASSRDRIATLRVGDPLDKNTDIGAINSKAQLEKIRELVASGVGGGRASSTSRPARSRRRASGSRPTFFTGVAAVAPHRPGGNLRPRPQRA